MRRSPVVTQSTKLPGITRRSSSALLRVLQFGRADVFYLNGRGAVIGKLVVIPAHLAFQLEFVLGESALFQPELDRSRGVADGGAARTAAGTNICSFLAPPPLSRWNRHRPPFSIPWRRKLFRQPLLPVSLMLRTIMPRNRPGPSILSNSSRDFQTPSLSVAALSHLGRPPAFSYP